MSRIDWIDALCVTEIALIGVMLGIAVGYGLPFTAAAIAPLLGINIYIFASEWGQK